MQIERLKEILTGLLAEANAAGVIEIHSGREGPSLAVTALTHGNEISGLLTVDRIYRMIRCGELELSAGSLQIWLSNYEILANASAISELTRHRGVDLNRVWGNGDPVIRDDGAGTHELAVRDRLLPWLKSVDHLIDLHSTSQPSTPMGIVVSDSPQMHSLVSESLDVDWLFTNIGEFINGVAMVERHQQECAERKQGWPSLSIAIEAGEHNDLTTVDRNIDNVLRLMQTTGLIDRAPSEAIAASQLLTIYSVGLAESVGNVVEWIYSDNPASFDNIQDGKEICRLHGTSVYADGETVMVMPRLKATGIGDEIFYLARLKTR